MAVTGRQSLRIDDGVRARAKVDPTSMFSSSRSSVAEIAQWQFFFEMIKFGLSLLIPDFCG